MATDFAAGCIGGAAGVLTGHPLDTVKVRIQTQCSRTPMYRGTYHCLNSIVAKEGVRGLYRGISSPLCGLTAVNALTFGIQGNVRRLMSKPDALSSQFIAGMVAGGCQSVIVSPMELVKSQIQVQSVTSQGTRYYSSPWDCCRQLVLRDGLREGLMRGFWVTAAREVPAFGIYFGTFELLTSGLYGDGRKTLLNMLLAGGAAGVASWAFTYPIDVIKTRIQTDGMAGVRLYSGSWDCARHSYRQEGWPGLWRGLNSACLRAFPTNAVTLATVSLVMQLARDHEDRRGVEEYFPADLFLQQLHEQRQPVAAYPLPRVSITTVTVQLDGAAGGHRRRRQSWSPDGQRRRRAGGGVWSPGLEQLLDALQLDAPAAVPVSHQLRGRLLEEAEQVTDDDVSEWVEWTTEVQKAGRHVRRNTRLQVTARLIQYEEVIEEEEDAAVLETSTV